MFIHPIEPYLLRPPRMGSPCLDRRAEAQRRRDALERDELGLKGLIAHPQTPNTAEEGITGGLYQPVARPALFLHREDYLIDGSVSKTRWSVVAGLDPARSPLSAVSVAPRDAVEAVAGHLRVAGADPGGITALYRDENSFVEKLVDARSGPEPLTTVQGADGETHRVWQLSFEEAEAITHLLERSGATLVGDLSLYRAVSRLKDESLLAPGRYPVVSFYNQRDFGVTLSGCAKVYPMGSGFSVNDFVASLHRQYEVFEFAIDRSRPPYQIYKDFFDSIRTEGITQKVAGVVIHGVDTALLVKVRDGESPPGVTEEIPEAALEYDVEWAERGIVEPYLGKSACEAHDVLTDWRELAENSRGLAVILNPPPKRHIPDLAELGWRLPFAALQLKPMVPRGLFLAPFQAVRQKS